MLLCERVELGVVGSNNSVKSGGLSSSPKYYKYYYELSLLSSALKIVQYLSNDGRDLEALKPTQYVEPQVPPHIGTLIVCIYVVWLS